MIIALFILFALVLGFLFYASYSIGAGIYIKAFCRMQTDERVVALTFDDGPDPVQTPKVLDVLKEHHVRATFFCIGSKVKGNEAIIQRMVAEGHTLGNHSYAHTWRFPLYSTQRMTADLEQCRRELEEASGQKVVWFRPPFGVTNPTIARVVKRLGYKTMGWNIRTLDTQQPSHEKIISHIHKRLRPGSIILLHDRMPGSEVLLGRILEELKKRKFNVQNDFVISTL
ncbi:polysaccharide deacetylase family protein [Bacteroides sp. 51]|uniref:polysaccharide deacetylase family protein n=1 Tax=Bacteroides sp. 51 TaxID=2302938 RepID=UPI0013D18E25|nr:polysaccharide deacetylase family protein [Bacteroides sp. 51]NDV81068.1 polysaccharide deacetylase family protein [Bacteroides sp. 51]